MASASPPSVIRLIVSPKAQRETIDTSTDSGIEIAMISVLRQAPSNMIIIVAVSVAAMTPS